MEKRRLRGDGECEGGEGWQVGPRERGASNGGGLVALRLFVGEISMIFHTLPTARAAENFLEVLDAFGGCWIVLRSVGSLRICRWMALSAVGWPERGVGCSEDNPR